MRRLYALAHPARVPVPHAGGDRAHEPVLHQPVLHLPFPADVWRSKKYIFRLSIDARWRDDETPLPRSDTDRDAIRSCTWEPGKSMSIGNTFLECFTSATREIVADCTHMSIGQFANAAARKCTLPNTILYIRCSGRLLPSITQILENARNTMPTVNSTPRFG